MLPKFISCFVLSTIAAGLPLALGVVPASAQARAVAGEDDEQVMVVKLAHAEVEEIVPVLNELFTDYGLILTGVPGSQCIVMHGSGELVQQAGTIIEELDTSGNRAFPEPLAELIQVHSYPIEDMIRLLQQSVHGSRALRLAADTINRQIVVNGTKSEVRMVRSLVEQFDQPTPALTADFFFLRGRIGESEAASKVALPAALKPIAATLAANGFANPTLLAPLQVHMDAGTRFSSRSVLVSERTPSRTPARTEFKVSGTARAEPDGKTVQLTLGANLECITEVALDSGKTATVSTPFSLDTTLSVQYGEYVLLAAAPHSTDEGDAVALVVRVTREQKR